MKTSKTSASSFENQGLSLTEAKRYIDAIDFSMIIKKMVEHQGWLQKEAEAVCRLYKNFLFINKKYRENYSALPPSEEVDEFWHNHILDTMNYRKDCEMIFGAYFDHYPYFGIDGRTTMKNLESAFETTQKLHIKEFGEPVYQITSNWSKLIAFLKKQFKIRPKRIAAEALNHS
ncbi:MAG: hypothetical protein JSR33_10470 [Proteobacteria bacterium]|nr:hypothetical protein [Pseudomonadota bacterium]